MSSRICPRRADAAASTWLALASFVLVSLSFASESLCAQVRLSARSEASQRTPQAQRKNQDQAKRKSPSKKSSNRARGEGRKALAAAAKLARVPRGSEAHVRTAAIEKALEAYALCATRFPKDSLVLSEAAFRRGQLLSKLRRVGAACEAFARSASAAPEAFGARALLERGHVERRAKKYSDALSSYRKSARIEGSRYAVTARLWAGKTLRTLGRAADAGAAFEALAQDLRVDASMRIRAFDELAMLAIRAGKLEDARRILATAKSALATEAQGDDKRAASVRRRLERMRAHKSLAKRESKPSRGGSKSPTGG